jgi:hypothetical protein
MYNEQLEFAKETKDDNYFINNIHKPKPEENYINDIHPEKIQTLVNNETKQKENNLPYSEQLNFINQRNEPVYIVEKANPLFYNPQVERNQMKKEMKKMMKNKGVKKEIKWRPGQNLKKKNPIDKNKKKYQTSVLNNNYKNNNIKGGFDLSTNTNTKGLFDPNLKLNELDEPTRTKKQQLDKLRKIKEYDLKYGKKMKNLQMYQNYLDAIEDNENRKNDYELHKKINYPNKYSKANKEELIKMLNIPKPKINYNAINLDFNFSKYEDIIKSLESQIEYEREQRQNTNMKYLQKVKEYEDLQISKQIGKPITLNKRSRSALRIYNNTRNNRRLNRYNKAYPAGGKFRRQMEKLKQRAKTVMNRAAKQTTEDLYHQNAKRMTKSAKKIIDKDFNRIYQNLSIKKNNIINNKFRSKSPTNTNKFISVDNINNNQQNDPQRYKTINIQNYNSNYIISPQSNVENSIVNEVFSNDDFKKMDNMNKFEIIANLNNQIDKYNKGIPQLVNKVNETINKINNENVLDNLSSNSHPLIKMASKSAGQVLQLHSKEIGEEIINDLLIEMVFELQFIEEQKNKKEERNNFTLFLQEYYRNVKEMENIEKEVLSKLSGKNPLAPYESVTNKLSSNNNLNNTQNINQLNDNDNIQISNVEILNPFDENYKENNNLSNGEEFLISTEKPKTYIATNHPKTILNAERYSKDFKDYMLMKGSFYYPNIFGIYDEVVKELTSQICNEECDKCLKEVDTFVDEMYREEVLKADLKK